jgi:hypothetical protein
MRLKLFYANLRRFNYSETTIFIIIIIIILNISLFITHVLYMVKDFIPLCRKKKNFFKKRGTMEQ